MKACPKCEKVGEILHASYKHVGGGAIQTIDHEMTCPEHGNYDGNFKDVIIEGSHSDADSANPNFIGPKLNPGPELDFVDEI